jgi:hypothetical protein
MMTLESDLPILRKREAIEEAEGLHLGLLTSRDGLSWVHQMFAYLHLLNPVELVVT